MIKKTVVPFVVMAIAFIFCVGGICYWPSTEKIYLERVPSPYPSEEFKGLSKSEKLDMLSDKDIENYKYIRDGIFPVDYTPNYIPLVILSVGAGASLTAMLSMSLDFYIENKRKKKGVKPHYSLL